MWSANIEQLKQLGASEAEVSQMVKLKQARLSDDTCVALLSSAHAMKHPFSSADAVVSLAGAGFSEPTILQIAHVDRLDSLSGDVVMLRLLGLSDSTVQFVLNRRLQNQPTIGSAAIARLKNTGLTERQIIDRINEGMTDSQAEAEATAREKKRNHAGTDFVRVRGRKPR
jgi:hypothetical protein